MLTCFGGSFFVCHFGSLAAELEIKGQKLVAELGSMAGSGIVEEGDAAEEAAEGEG